MKDKLEVGIYVRTKWGYICKIININDFREPSMKYGVEASYLKDIMFIGDDDILKTSHNIIDLIEVGDYVNGEKVIRIYEKGECYDGSNYGLITKTIETENDNYETIPHDHLYVGYSIRSIVTKEMFSSMEYRLGDDK